LNERYFQFGQTGFLGKNQLLSSFSLLECKQGNLIPIQSRTPAMIFHRYAEAYRSLNAVGTLQSSSLSQGNGDPDTTLQGTRRRGVVAHRVRMFDHFPWPPDHRQSFCRDRSSKPTAALRACCAAVSGHGGRPPPDPELPSNLVRKGNFWC